VVTESAAAALPRIRIRESFGDRVFLIFVTAFLTIILLTVLYPLIYVISSSFSSGHAVTIGKVWLLPVEPTLHGYRTAFAYPQILRGFQNSAIYTAFGTLINVVMTILIAYPLSRRDFYGRKVIMMGLVFTMMFYGGLIPTYLTVRAVGILNTRLAMVVPQALAVWQVIIARTFFQSTIADELAEAADIDGCSDLGFVWSVVLPLSKPIIAVIQKRKR
jgi:putative aldouronate transport system permease protein